MDKRILLVEDEEDTREAVSEFLSEAGFQVTVAKDGEIAIELLRNNLYDMVVLDIMLPKVNGFVVLNWLRKRSQIPVLMLTAMHDEYTQLMSFDEQADDYITKPFSLMVLRARVERLFARAGRQEGKEFQEEGYRFSFDRQEFAVEGKPVVLSKT
ncbi:MAG: response regulator, partial [[Clostridium] innocuum]|nr:response regulator [[Clostridium] innocuum]